MTKEELITQVRNEQMSLLEFAVLAAKIEDDASLANFAKTLNYVAGRLVEEVEKNQIPVSFV
jgi:hypothetical protein